MVIEVLSNSSKLTCKNTLHHVVLKPVSQRKQRYPELHWINTDVSRMVNFSPTQWHSNGSCRLMKRKIEKSSSFGVTVDKACSYIHQPLLVGWAFRCTQSCINRSFGFRAGSPQAAQRGSWVRKKASGTSDLRQQLELEPRPCRGLSQDSSVTAWSKMGPQSSSTWRSPWLWAESGLGPRHQGPRPGGSRPEAAACLNQGGPGEQREPRWHTVIAE